jgi:hypothetical protein
MELVESQQVQEQILWLIQAMMDRLGLVLEIISFHPKYTV